MGIGEWSKVQVYPESVFNIKYHLIPGEYWMMYEQGSQVFYIKDLKQKTIFYQQFLASPLELMTLVTHLHISEKMESQINDAIEALKEKDTFHKIPGLIDHHIIPKHLWDKSQLIKQTIRITDINLNGEENIIELPYKIHKSFHGEKSGYSELIISRLRAEWNRLVNANRYNDPGEVEGTVLGLIAAIREDLEYLVSESISIGDLYSVDLFNFFKLKKKPKKRRRS